MENNTIRVNALPTLTWHRLHVNACKTEPYTPVKPCTVQTVSENGVAAVSALEPCTDCSAVETGVGRNVDNLFQWGMTVTVPENGSDTLRMEIGSEDGGDCAAFVHVQAEAGSELTLESRRFPCGTADCDSCRGRSNCSAGADPCRCQCRVHQ